MNKSIAGIVAFGAIIALGYAWSSTATSTKSEQVAMAFPPTQVATITVTPSDLPRSLSAIGTLEAVRQVLISSEVNGRVNELSFQAGQVVNKADVLLQIDDAEEQADLQRYRSELKLAKKSLNRSKKLKGLAASQSRIDEAQLVVEQSQANIAHTLAVIDKKQVEAPFNGVLGIRKVNQGEFLKPGTAIVSLTDTSQFLLNFSLTERALEKVKVGQAVEFKVDAIADHVFSAVITSIEPQVDQNTHTISVQATIDDTVRQLYPGLFAHVSVQLEPQANVFQLPETAVQTTTYGSSVYLVKKDQKNAYTVERVAVKTGQRQNGLVVIQQGVSQGDTVVISGQNRLRDGAPVALKEAVGITPMVKPSSQS